MPKGFTEYDPAEFLDSPQKISAYLTATVEESNGDPAAVRNALNAAARAQNMSQLARELGMSREGLYQALSPEGNPSYALIVKLADLFGCRLVFKANKPKRARK